MSEAVQRRINFIVELTHEKSKIEDLDREDIFSALLAVLKHTCDHLTYTDTKWLMGVTHATLTPAIGGELVSYKWYITDSDAFEDEDEVPEGLAS